MDDKNLKIEIFKTAFAIHSSTPPTLPYEIALQEWINAVETYVHGNEKFQVPEKIQKYYEEQRVMYNCSPPEKMTISKHENNVVYLNKDKKPND